MFIELDNDEHPMVQANQSLAVRMTPRGESGHAESRGCAHAATIAAWSGPGLAELRFIAERFLQFADLIGKKPVSKILPICF
ncbi:hypothetical protein [Thioflavicoccus mobilis]|uniref:hypothetical protein n=1 Tax=Thioflavicoccus mobilis TaxID=80679 RepID=UPI0012F8F812|nr:hypothetical protein [Thioflavicoccus mobilis]